MSEKIISQEELKRILHYCPETGVFTNRVARGSQAIKGAISGSIEVHKYRTIKINYRIYKAHRLAFLYMTGELPEYPETEVDHINQLDQETVSTQRIVLIWVTMVVGDNGLEV